MIKLEHRGRDELRGYQPRLMPVLRFLCRSCRSSASSAGKSHTAVAGAHDLLE